MRNLPPKFSTKNYAALEKGEAFGAKIGLLASVFGCWHNRDLSRPFSDNDKTYRVCLDCGARRKFDPQTLETFGPFYFPPAISLGIRS